MDKMVFDSREGCAVLDIIREYLLYIPGDLPHVKRAALGKLMDEAQCAADEGRRLSIVADAGAA